MFKTIHMRIYLRISQFGFFVLFFFLLLFFFFLFFFFCFFFLLFLFLSIHDREISYRVVYKFFFIAGENWPSCRIHRLHLCRGVRLPQPASWIWGYTILWRGSSNAGAWGEWGVPLYRHCTSVHSGLEW